MSDESGARLLTLEELADVADGDALHTQEARDRLARVIQTDPRFAEQLEHLEALARDAGVKRGSYRGIGLEENQDFDRLLADDGWRDPAEVLDPDGQRGFSYGRLIAIARARAARAEDPSSLHAMRERLERARAASRGETAAGWDLAESELDLLDHVAWNPGQALDELLEWAGWRLDFARRFHEPDGASVAEPLNVRNAVRHLLGRGYVEREHWADDEAPIFVTPWGKATAVVYGRERHHRLKSARGKRPRALETSLPDAQEIGPRMEDLGIDFLNLSKRTRKALVRAGLRTAGALAGLTKKQLLGLEGIGRKGVEEIEMELASVRLEPAG